MSISENNTILFSHKMDKRNQISNDSARLALLYNFDRVISNFASTIESQFTDKLSANMAKILVMRSAEKSFETIYASVTDEVAFGAKFAAANFDSKENLAKIESDVNYMDFKQGHQEGLAKMIRNRRAMEALRVMDPVPSMYYIPSLSTPDLHVVLDAWESIDEFSLLKKGDQQVSQGPVPSAMAYSDVLNTIVYGSDGSKKLVENQSYYKERKAKIIATLRDNCREFSDNGVVYSMVQLAVIIENALNRDDYIIHPTMRAVLKDSELLTLSVNIKSATSASKAGKDVFNSAIPSDLEEITFLGDTTVDASVDRRAMNHIIQLFVSWMFESKGIYSASAYSDLNIRSSAMDRLILPLRTHPLSETIEPTLRRIHKAYIPDTPSFNYIKFLEEVGKKGTPGSSTHIDILESRSQSMIRRDLRDVAKVIEDWRLSIEKVDITSHIDEALMRQGTSELTLIERTNDCEFRLRSSVDEFTKTGTIKVESNRPIRSHERLIAGRSGFNDALVKRSVTLGGCAIDTIEFEKVSPFFVMFDELYGVSSDAYMRTYTVGEVIRRLNKRSIEKRPYLKEISNAPERLMVSQILSGMNVKSVALDYEIASTDLRDNRMVLLNNLLELHESSKTFNVQREQFKIGLIKGANPINVDRSKHTAIRDICERLFVTELFTTPVIQDAVAFDYKETNDRYFKRMDTLDDKTSNPYVSYTPSENLVNLVNNKYAVKLIGNKFDSRHFRDLSLFKFDVHMTLDQELAKYIIDVQKYVMEVLNVDSTAFKLFAKLVSGTAREADKLELDQPKNRRIIALLMNLVFEPVTNFSEDSTHLAMLYLDKFVNTLIADNS